VREGAARRGVEEGVVDGVEVVRTRRDGDQAIAALAVGATGPIVVVSADRALRTRSGRRRRVVGPSWLLDRLVP
jgi:hypothetical protein